MEPALSYNVKTKVLWVWDDIRVSN